jgi:3-deoxy-D-manno-octulosonic-acid transferase
MHRLEFWKNTFSEKSIPWKLRSKIVSQVKSGEIILWDTMGELLYAYSLAKGAFVGGSLAPVGGQNFLEPLTCGLRPVIGPSWFNFYWVGKEIFEQKLVFQVNSWQDVSELFQRNCDTPVDREDTRQALQKYVKNRQGGTKQVCNELNNYFLTKQNEMK